jgi:hypothetical protein
MDKDHFICISILVEIGIHTSLRGGKYNMAIVINQYRFTALQIILLWLHPKSFKAAMLEHFLFGNFR